MFFIGLDLGQAQDFTAFVVIERNNQEPAPEEQRQQLSYSVRHIERFALGTPYTRISKAMRQVISNPALSGGSCLVVDATGVGKAVVDLLKQEGIPLKQVTITGGEKVSRDGGAFTVPKRDLVAMLQVLLQNKRLQIASNLPLSQVLVKELLDFRMKIDERTAHESFGAWREGTHDDLVLAVALAVWYAETISLPIDLSGFRTVSRSETSITRGYTDFGFGDY